MSRWTSISSAPARATASPEPLPAGLKDLRVYVITAGGNVKRQRHARAQLQRRGLASNARFVTAFDSAVLPDAAVQCIFGNFSLYANGLKPLTPGEASNSLKQLAAAFDAVLSGAKFVLVLEDDVFLPLSIASVLDLVLRTAPEAWDIVFLSECFPGLVATRKDGGVQVAPRLWRTGRGRCADAYLLSAGGARKVLASLPMRAVFDWHVNFISGAELLWLEPFAAWQDLSRFSSQLHVAPVHGSVSSGAVAAAASIAAALAVASVSAALF